MKRRGWWMLVAVAAVTVAVTIPDPSFAQQKKLVLWTHWDQNPEFNKWYDEIHGPDALENGSFGAVHRFRAIGGGHRPAPYLAIWEAPYDSEAEAWAYIGPRAQALIGYLSGRLGASQRVLEELLSDVFGVVISLGSISAVQQRVSTALAVPVVAARQFSQRQRVQYVDETSWQESAQAKWLWVNATADVTAFHLLTHRNAECAQTVIDRQAKGIVTTDRYSGYHWLAQRRRQICWAHLKRDFQAIAERGGEAGQLGTQLLAQEKALFEVWHQCRAAMSHRLLAQRLTPIKNKIKNLLQTGSQLSHSKTRHTCQHILKVWDALWTFVRVEGVEPTNNNAERALRRAVLWRRKSFGTQSTTGSTFVARILTTITTLRQQKRNVLEYLTEACTATLTQTLPPSLLPL